MGWQALNKQPERALSKQPIDNSESLSDSSCVSLHCALQEQRDQIARIEVQLLEEKQMSYQDRQRHNAELLDARGREMALEAQVAPLIFKVSGRWERALDKQPQGAEEAARERQA